MRSDAAPASPELLAPLRPARRLPVRHRAPRCTPSPCGETLGCARQRLLEGPSAARGHGRPGRPVPLLAAGRGALQGGRRRVSHGLRRVRKKRREDGCGASPARPRDLTLRTSAASSCSAGSRRRRESQEKKLRDVGQEGFLVEFQECFAEDGRCLLFGCITRPCALYRWKCWNCAVIS